MALILALVLLLHPVLSVHAEYNCLCSYGAKVPVYESANETSTILGYMYDFDCKPLADSGTEATFDAVQFEGNVS